MGRYKRCLEFGVIRVRECRADTGRDGYSLVYVNTSI